MRFPYKTDYGQDLDLFKSSSDRFWYGLLALVLLSMPLWVDTFWLGEVSYVFILGIVGIGLMILTGYAGQVSIGHAAFLGIGAYTHAILLSMGTPFVVSLVGATALSTLIGAGVGFPALRVAGIYLAMATFAFNFLVEFVLVRWESMTGGFSGFAVASPEFLGVSFTSGGGFYYICLFSIVLAILLTLNLLRSPTGRALIALRDSETAAQALGVRLARYKTTAFAISAGLTGFAGALFAHRIGYLAPDIFTIMFSIQLLLMVVVGGMGSIHGAIFGAIFVGALPQLIAIMRDYLPDSVARQPGIEPGIFGLLLVLTILFEPRGIYGRWLKIKHYFSVFPMHKKAAFSRQKSYTKSER
ncbi:branched-chain amino acid ABC transporter permease [Mesorhizobium sp. CCNWLW179-1]|uniref:branched-chain amino acid ABC transporter permease n=1 Tax=unclassified Mesorhizobium TaxID=325217 RepID=UPI0030144A60